MRSLNIKDGRCIVGICRFYDIYLASNTWRRDIGFENRRDIILFEKFISVSHLTS